jgi:hypothetical protein
MGALAMGAALLVIPATASANEQCMAQLKQQAAEAGLAYDSDYKNVAVWSPRRKSIAPIFAATQRCLRGAYKKTERRTLNGAKGAFYGTTVEGGGGADVCELPDLGIMGGHGEHRNDYAIWIRCYHLGAGGSGGGSFGSTSGGGGGGTLDCSNPAQLMACANRALSTLPIPR